MFRQAALLLSAALLAAVPAHAAPRDPEARLARALEGRVAGEPVKCLPLSSIRSSEIIDRTAILYRVGSTLYVNRPTNGARSLNETDTLVFRSSLAQLCSIDVVQTFDSASRFFTGSVFLGEFVPYRRAKN